MNYIIVNTIQPYRVWVSLQMEKSLSVNPDISKIKGFTEGFDYAYDWMRNQMGKRVNGYTGNYPWWGWSADSYKCDLRSIRHDYYSHTHNVKITLKIPSEQVLVSHFDGWHAVLNNMYCALTSEEDDKFDKEFYTAQYSAYCKIAKELELPIPTANWQGRAIEFSVGTSLWKLSESLPDMHKITQHKLSLKLSEFTKRKEQSWERIFDLELLDASSIWGDVEENKSRHQCCFETLDLAQVIKVKPFRGTRDRAKEFVDKSLFG